jgi:hypothetical protein
MISSHSNNVFLKDLLICHSRENGNPKKPISNGFPLSWERQFGEFSFSDSFMSITKKFFIKII